MTFVGSEPTDLDVQLQVSNATVCLDELWQQNSAFRRNKSLKLLDKIFANIKKYPTDPKYRQIKAAIINNKHPAQVYEILLASGFTQNKNGIHINLYDNQLRIANAIGQLIHSKRVEANARLEQERQEIIRKNKLRTDTILNDKASKKSALKKKIKSEQMAAAKRHKPAVTSTANKLKFGMTPTKVKFETSSGKGG